MAALPDTVGMSDTAERFQIFVNDQTVELTDGPSLRALIGQLGLDARKIAIELNREIVPKSQYDQIMLSAQDRLEIVHFIGGG